MELVLLTGVQASGESTFCRERLFSTHARLNLDMLRTRHREAIPQCLPRGESELVIDNTNLTRADLARFIVPARAAQFAVHGSFFESRVEDPIARNAARSGKARVPDAAIRHSSARLELPGLAEGSPRFPSSGSASKPVSSSWSHGAKKDAFEAKIEAKMRRFEAAHDLTIVLGIYLVVRLDGRGFTRLKAFSRLHDRDCRAPDEERIERDLWLHVERRDLAPVPA